MFARGGGDWNPWADPEEMACSSGVFLMIADARLISVGFGGADALLGGKTDCLSGDVDGIVGPRFTSFEALLFDGG